MDEQLTTRGKLDKVLGSLGFDRGSVDTWVRTYSADGVTVLILVARYDEPWRWMYLPTEEDQRPTVMIEAHSTCFDEGDVVEELKLDEDDVEAVRDELEDLITRIEDRLLDQHRQLTWGLQQVFGHGRVG